MNNYIIAEYFTKNIKGDFSKVEFKDRDNNKYRLNETVFLVKGVFLNKKHKDLFSVINKNPAFVKYKIKLDKDNKITNIYEMPLIPQYLYEFYNEYPNGENYSLLVNKFGRFREKTLDYMDQSGRGLFHKFKIDENLIKKINSKIDNEKELLNDKMDIFDETMKLKWRMAIGLGNASAYNNGFTFHPIYGIPYIPGQNLKSLIRNYIINEKYNNIGVLSDEVLKDNKIQDKQEFLAEQDPAFCHVFGCSEKSYDGKARKGKVYFMDAFPSSQLNIEPDIINPHFVEYFKGKGKSPNDSDKLNPVFFLTVKDSDFRFLFYIKKKDNRKSANIEFEYDKELANIRFKDHIFPGISDFFKEDEKISILLRCIFYKAIEKNGIGAKTNVAYGRFKNL
ncbi:MAG: type III-B CRISPR module RAMP protein Cmr6 [Deltaproteobacteria bacterium]